jgi:predicted nuclease with TOPRIM domain
VELFSANDRISDLKESSQKNETTIINLEEEINNKNSNIESLKDRTRALKNNIASKKAALTKRAEWINDLKKRDDEIVENAMHLVDNFMKISDTNNAFGEVSSASRDELLVDTLTLVNTLDTQRNQRKMFVEDLSQKLQK